MHNNFSGGRKNRLVRKMLAGTILGAFLAVPAVAQETQADPTLTADDYIVVTAQRRAESIQDVPIAITAISGDVMDRTNARGVEDILNRAPNVSFVTNGSRDRKEISIRGVSNLLDPYTATRSATYAMYIDEFNVIVGTSNPNILDLERFEVLRGPQGTYFGRNSLGGAINVSTRKPGDTWYGELNLDYSSFDTKRVSAIVNVPVLEGILSVRGAGLIESSDGNIKNINPTGTPGNNTNYKSGRLTARFTPAANITSDTTFSYSRERNGMRAGVPTGFLTNTWRNLYYGGAAGLADPDGVGFYPDNQTRVNFDEPSSVGTTFWYLSNRTEVDFDTFTVTAVGGYLESQVFQFGDVDGSSFSYFTEDQDIDRSSLNGELRIQSNGNTRFEWSLGANIGRDLGDSVQVTRYGSGGLHGRPDGFAVSDSRSKGKTTYQAVFGQATYNLSDQLAFTLGARYSHEKVSLQQIRFSNQVLTDNIDRSVTFNDLSPKVTVTYKPADNILAYATVSRGFKSGGLQSAQLLLRDSYGPEKLWNYEAGFKFDAFDRRLRVDLSGFYMDWKGVQQAVRFQFLDENDILRTVNGIDNAEKAEVYGIDASADLRILDSLNIGVRGGWTKAEFKKFPNAFVDGMTIDLAGKPMVNSPEWTFGADVEYRFPISDTFEAFIRPEWSYRSKTYSNVFAYRYETWPFIASGYHNVNLRIGTESDRIRLIGYVENLFKADYYTNTYEKAFYSGVQLEPSVRRIGVTASFKFF
ncbi:TonB-dependent receptor [Sphingosinicella microcystinivorans]|uniref:TonB-dependent receptor n=1 Tax=Sphingosinicella microcystinivorans TaxID=335406 RepID=UPI0022F3E1B1|nr:TonB-dependent receptor [Sphingosinicella microcystinivorans]WBX84152.1 TonB-dependent receptor [Sphingosinicella microcystinivorans]